ncbi:DUF418 domain-containing protein [Microbulbifer sp. CNSA002]|uniref:DUF418 domain-containing protein n=1 Tax=unclassified Microbulbifer TaxID=2619833 RepID=UPI0039B42679
MQDRISQLDLLRGFALLGLPLMNMINFSMPMAAYLNPKAYLPNGPLNDFLFSFFHLFADQKFMGLFAMLFGAGIILLAEKREQQNKSAAKIHYSRNFWLLLIGLCHGIFIWEGDILMIYAFIAMFVYLLRKLRGSWLIALGVITLALSAYSSYLTGAFIEPLTGEARYATAAIFAPDTTQIQQDIEIYRGGFWDLVGSRLVAGNLASSPESAIVISYFSLSIILKAAAMMLLGMGLFKLDILRGQASSSAYKKLAITGLAIGVTLTGIGLIWNYSHDWSMDDYFTYGAIFNLVGSTFTSIGYIGLICLWFKLGKHLWIKGKIQSVGRMAFTNYLAQSFICIYIFYGFGLGLYGELTRIEVLGVCVLLGLFQLAYSDLWLKAFRMGPLEWFWRTLTYFRFAPLIKERGVPVTEQRL